MGMARFSETLMDHFQSPRNMRRMAKPDIVGMSGLPGQGRYIILYLKIKSELVTAASFECHGCGVTVACGSALTELALGRTIGECDQLEDTDIVAALDGIPADKQDRARVALIALRDALSQLRSRPSSSDPE